MQSFLLTPETQTFTTTFHTMQTKTWPIYAVQVAHQDFVWRMRADPRITSIFAALWGARS